jgi:hypothetical protein
MDKINLQPWGVVIGQLDDQGPKLQNALDTARAIAQTEKVRRLREMQTELRTLWREKHREALVELGRVLEQYLPDVLLFDEIDASVRRWV